jgi:glycosyltransferase involved in cell wall biosynthesis
VRLACIATSKVPSRTANSIQVMKVCQSLAGLGHTVRLWLPGENPLVSGEELARDYGLRARFEITWRRAIRPLRHYDFCLLAARAGHAWGADLIYAWPYPAAAVASQMGWPSLLEVHDRPQGRLGPQWVRLFLNGRGARRLVATTEALRRWLSATYRKDLTDPFALVAPNGVDLERYVDLPRPAEARASLDLPDLFTAVYTGHLYPGRGIDMILALAKANPTFQFIVAGGDPEAVEAWQGEARAAGLSHVRFLGFVPNEDLPRVQAAGDVLLLPHGRKVMDSGGGDIAEWASPMKVFEYLASGRAILASDLPVLREVLSEDNSVLAPPEDAAAWNQALRSLAVDSRRREALGVRARADAARHSWEERARRALAGLEPGHGG